MACVGIRIVPVADSRASLIGAADDMPRRTNVVLGRRRGRRLRGICADCVGEGVAVVKTTVEGGRRRRTPTTVAPQLDQLMKESVTEIVKNINSAPFLVQVYSEDATRDGQLCSSATPFRLEIEKATSETWPFLQQSWEGGNSTPDGVILVEELGSADTTVAANEEVDTASSESSCCTSNERAPSSSAKVWGLLVQGRELSYPACYILKTCRVQCCFGFSTHFSLAKVDCFGQDVDYHMRKLWLQR